MNIRPKNWQDFQHYKDRAPAWIKLHRYLLDDFEFHCLPVASRALAPMLWLLAAESKEPQTGVIDANVQRLAFRLRMTVEDVSAALKPLIDQGFFIADQDASALLASCNRDAIPEKRREETEKEKEREKTTGVQELTPLASHDDDPEPDSDAARPRRSPVELKTWIASLPEGEDPITEIDPILDYAEKAGIEFAWLELCWRRFEADMTEKRTRKRDWRAHFRNAVRGNWYRLWWIRDGQSGLTTMGEQARRAA